MRVTFDTADYQEAHQELPSGYANQWIFSIASPADYTGKAGVDYLILDDMNWRDAQREAISWALFNGEGYETLYVAKDAGSTYAPVWGN